MWAVTLQIGFVKHHKGEWEGKVSLFSRGVLINNLHENKTANIFTGNLLTLV